MTRKAATGRSANENECALIPIMARSNMKLHDEAGYIDAGPLAHHKIALATHGRSIHLGQQRKSSHGPANDRSQA